MFQEVLIADMFSLFTRKVQAEILAKNSEIQN
jgi:hypothetical protein